MSGGWIWSPSSSPGSEAGVVTRLGDERGVALILGLVVLMTLSALALAFLAVSALEPRISRNLHDASRRFREIRGTSATRRGGSERSAAGIEIGRAHV